MERAADAMLARYRQQAASGGARRCTREAALHVLQLMPIVMEREQQHFADGQAADERMRQSVRIQRGFRPPRDRGAQRGDRRGV